jgi:Na+/proline symporter
MADETPTTPAEYHYFIPVHVTDLLAGARQQRAVMGRLTLVGVVLTPVLLGIAWWFSRQAPVAILALAMLPSISSLIWWHRGNQRAALAFALIGFSAAAIMVALTLVHQTESGRLSMWRIAAAIVG